MFNKDFSTSDWEATNSGLILPQGSLSKDDKVRNQFNSAPIKKTKTKTVEISRPALVALNIEIDRLTDQYLDHTGDFQMVLKLQDALLKLGEEYGVTIVCHVYELNGEPTIDIQTEEILYEVAGELSEYQIVSDAAYGGVEVKDDVDLLLNPNVSKEEFYKNMKKGGN